MMTSFYTSCDERLLIKVVIKVLPVKGCHNLAKHGSIGQWLDKQKKKQNLKLSSASL